MKIRWFTYCGNFWEHSLFYFVQMAFEGKVVWFCSVLAHLWQYAVSIIALTDQQMQWSNAGSKAVKNPSNSLTIQGADVILALTVSYSKNTICDSGSKILSLWQWTIFLMVEKEPLKTDFFFNVRLCQAKGKNRIQEFCAPEMWIKNSRVENAMLCRWGQDFSTNTCPYCEGGKEIFLYAAR